MTKKSKVPNVSSLFNRKSRPAAAASGTNANKLGTGGSSRGMVNPLRSVGTKLFIIFFCSILVFVLFIGYFSYNKAKSIITKDVSSAALNTVTQASSRINLMMSKYESESQQLLFDSTLNQTLDTYFNAKDDFTKVDSKQKIANKLKSVAYSDNTLFGIYLITKDKSEIAYQGIFDPKVMDEPWYKNVEAQDGKSVWLEPRKGGYMVPPSDTQGADSNAFSRIVLARKMSNQNTFSEYGLLILDVKTDGLQKELNALNIGKGGKAYIVNPVTDRIVISADPKLIGQPSPIKLDAKKTGGMLDLKVDGKKSFVVYHNMDANGWDLVAYAPTSVLTSQANSILNTTALIAVIAALLAILIGFMVMRMIGRPLGELRNLMRQGARGNLKVRTNFRSRDEIGEVGSSFNEMMEQITLLVNGTNNTAQEVLATAMQLTDASKKTALSAKEISMATEEIAGGATTLASEAERGNDLTTNIGQQMHSVVQANMEMGKSAEQVRKVSEEGTTYMADLIDKTNSTEKMTRSMVEKVDKLKESTTSIRKILEVLNNMTKQTNILSLNATIEAARAGAAGKGFMVVADEIRKLADQSRQSIDVVGQITETIQSEIDETVSVLSEAYPIFNEQITSVKETDLIFKDVHNQMGGFISQLDEVTNSIEQLEQSQSVLMETMTSVSAVSQQSSATSEEVASLSSEQLKISEGLVDLSTKLDNVSNSLKDSLTRFEF